MDDMNPGTNMMDFKYYTDEILKYLRCCGVTDDKIDNIRQIFNNIGNCDKENEGYLFDVDKFLNEVCESLELGVHAKEFRESFKLSIKLHAEMLGIEMTSISLLIDKEKYPVKRDEKTTMRQKAEEILSNTENKSYYIWTLLNEIPDNITSVLFQHITCDRKVLMDHVLILGALDDKVDDQYKDSPLKCLMLILSKRGNIGFEERASENSAFEDVFEEYREELKSKYPTPYTTILAARSNLGTSDYASFLIHAIKKEKIDASIVMNYMNYMDYRPLPRQKVIDVIRAAHEVKNYELFGSLLENFKVSEITPEILTMLFNADLHSVTTCPLLKAFSRMAEDMNKYLTGMRKCVRGESVDEESKENI